MIDSTDRALLQRLQDDARVPNAEMARDLGMAASAVHQRVKKLEARGVIEGYGARLDASQVERGLLAFVFLSTAEPLGRFPVAEALAAMPEVLEVHDIAGEDCYLIKVRVADTDALHTLLRERLAAMELVRSTRTIIALRTLKETTVLPLPEPT